jgi:hypothetical protein
MELTQDGRVRGFSFRTAGGAVHPLRIDEAA